MRVERGDAFDRIVQEELADAERYQNDHDRIDALKAHPIRTGLVVLGLATIPALLVIAAVFWFLGRERRTGYDREYEQEPPTDTEPALVPTLLRRGGEAGSYEFTATLFDLIRRGVYKAVPTTTERSIWGGLRHQTISDLEVSAGEDRELRSWERDVANVVDGVLDGGSERLSRFRDEIEDERESMQRPLHVVQGTTWPPRRIAAGLVPLDGSRAARRRHDPLRARGRAARLPRACASGARCTRATRMSSSSASASA